jgi:hypothetical protein
MFSDAKIAPMEDGGENNSLGGEDIDASLASEPMHGGHNNPEEVVPEGEEEESEKGGGGFFALFRRNEVKYIDPPMPYMGPPLKYRVIVDRVQKAKPVTKKILDLCRTQVVDSVMEGATVPVDDATERVKVTKDVSNRIGLKRTMFALKSSLESTFTEITRILNWRRIAVDLMNHNTSNAIVRKIEPINVAESRTVLSTRPDGQQDSDMW